jgi:bifunctional DNA-binding transcriptional regulator/antitoxin component of YhaV-PrlF toxin-antitoxin module
MTEVKIQAGGEIALPAEVRQRYQMSPHTMVRVIEVPSGVLLVPMTGEPMGPALREELEQWQALTAESWAMFPYETDPDFDEIAGRAP